MSLREPEVQARNVSEGQFPKEGTKTEQLKFLLKYVILASSGHNTQHRLFKIVTSRDFSSNEEARKGLDNE
jgi:hypothetical protein